MTGSEQFTAQLESGPDEADQWTTICTIFSSRYNALERCGNSTSLEVSGSAEAMQRFNESLGELACAEVFERRFEDSDGIAKGQPTEVIFAAKPGEEDAKTLIAEVEGALYERMLDSGARAVNRKVVEEDSAGNTATGRRMLADAGV